MFAAQNKLKTLLSFVTGHFTQDQGLSFFFVLEK